MALERKSFWMPRDGGCLTNGEMPYNNSSRVESKRGYQWFMDASGSAVLSNKKQVIGSGISDMNVPPWDASTSLQPVPGQFTNRFFGSESESIRTANLVGMNDSSVGNENMNARRRHFEDQFLKKPAVSLCMTRTVEDPSSRLNFGGIRKVRVNEVRDSDNGMPVSMGQSYVRGGNSTITLGTNYSKSDFNTMSLGPAYHNGDENTISIGTTFSKGDDSFSSMGHSNKEEGSYIVASHNYQNEDESILSMGQPLDKGDANFISMGQLFGKGTDNVMSMAPSYSKAHESFMSIGSTYSKASENFISMGSYLCKDRDNIVPTGLTYDKLDHGTVTIGSTYDKDDSNILSIGQTYNKDESNIISFRGSRDEPETNPSSRSIGSYDLLTSTQNVTQNLEALGQKDLVEPNVEASKTNSRGDTSSKNKEPKISKKLPPNNFPANVKSLLSTGMLDGIRVKYVSWSREKNLNGVIKGVAYMCGCKECQFSKALNAYEFERHAGCKTKHPNNHIYFENGKTIYAVVQELKNTPQEALFGAIQTVTGSAINQKNFRSWKASYKAATIELQRIYGKEEVVMPS